MAIVVKFEVKGATSAKYNKVIRRLTEIGQRVPDGQLYHVCLMPVLHDLGIEARSLIGEVYNIIGP